MYVHFIFGIFFFFPSITFFTIFVFIFLIVIDVFR